MFHTITKRCWHLRKAEIVFLLFYWRLSPQFFMDKSIINRDEPCFSDVIVLDND
ncbi:hypothetical protein ECA2909 [Pectobacterium atrosepticum SCRI1043]|uniref:Uncharacterized protein n=1 Tax=Pectobacterium atrosepticum (strain SCRI 1043 / ATCC BAA-672) TaxID=218491 RepID=Q6D335_PECAS|nr:hypothetical protein ECA2909 [Pectobacterium atrosepticum SCRI1043]